MNLNDIQKMIDEKSREMAKRHADIIEAEVKSAMARFNCHANELIIEYHPECTIHIKLVCSKFRISNQFIIMDGEIKEML